jgi:hypothetical protein
MFIMPRLVCNYVHSIVLQFYVCFLGSLGYFLAWGPMLLNGCSSEKPMLMGVSIVCSLLSLVSYPKCVHFASLTLAVEYWGSG